MTRSLTIAMVGNPNSGKTTLFNALTGEHQRVANYPGVTVEVKEGGFRRGDLKVHVVDLPGTYSLDSASPDARVARDYIIEHPEAVVVQVMNASDFERHAFLTAQLVELGAKLILVLNMSDRARHRGISFDLEMISERLGCEVVEAVAAEGEGIDDVMDAIAGVGDRKGCQVEIDYGEEFDEHILQVEGELSVFAACIKPYPLRWLAIKILEGDGEATDVLRRCLGSKADDIIARAGELGKHIEWHHGDSLPVLLAERRHGFASGLYREVSRRDRYARGEVTERIDDVVTHKWLGIPLFLFIMYLVFYATFTIGAIPMGWLESIVGWGSEALRTAWPGDGPLKSLVIDGVMGGAGNVIVFVPNIAILFLCISIIEDTGYMARVAFITDRFMHKVGLHGKSVIPMIIGFGCSVPAIMATRTIENRRDRLATMLVIPLMSCGARLPIYTLFIPAFFPKEYRATLLWVIYLVGVLLALVVVRLLRSTLIRGDTVPFVMELPPYRAPLFKGLVVHVWERTKLYLRKAGTIILGLSIVMWFVTSYPKPAGGGGQVVASQSIAGQVGHAIEPATRPLGFDWRINTALIGGLAAKEIVVAQLGIIFSMGDGEEAVEPLRETLARRYSPLVGLCVMLFCLISAPCFATVAAVRQESGSWLYAIGQFLGLTLLAYVVCLIVYQVGGLLGA